MSILSTTIKTPVGPLVAAATDAGICLLDYAGRRGGEAVKSRLKAGLGLEFAEGEHPLFAALRSELDQYFSGTRTSFDVPLQLVGSEFQNRVWGALLQVPYGETRSYKAQSGLLSIAGAVRAVARANGENGLAILLPCHRIVGESGSLTGYSGGLEAKRWLLDHEQRYAGKVPAQMALFTDVGSQ